MAIIMKTLLLCVISAILLWNPAQATDSNAEEQSSYKVTTILDPPYVMKGPRPGTGGYVGIVPDILKEIQARLNCTFELLHVKDAKYGSLRLDGNWTGMIGEIVKGEVDIAAASLTITSKRMESVDFSHPFMDAGVRILLKIPGDWTSLETVFILLSPYRPEVWVIGILMFVAVSVMFYVIGRYSPSESPNEKDGLSLNNSFFLSFAAFMLQGYHTIPRSVSARVLICFWWMFTIFFLAGYIANLTSFFLTKEPIKRTLPVMSFKDLAAGRMPYGTVNGGSTSNFFKKSPDKVDRIIGKYLQDNAENSPKTVADGIKKVRTGNFAFIMEGPSAEYAASRMPCDLMVVGEPRSPAEYGFACRKGSGICNKISLAIQSMKEDDVLMSIRKKWFAGECGNVDDDEYIFHGLPFFSESDSKDITMETGVNLRRFGAPITFICVGIGLAILALVAEIIYASKTRHLPGHSALRDDEVPIEEKA